MGALQERDAIYGLYGSHAIAEQNRAVGEVGLEEAGLFVELAEA